MKYKEFYTVLPIKDNSPKVIQGVVQYDTANVVHCTLTCGDDPFDFSGYTDILLDILKPDGTRVKSLVTSDTRYNVENPYMITVKDPEDGRISFQLTGQATIVTGTYFARISILSNGVVMSTVRLNYVVQEGIEDVRTEEFSGDHYSGIANVLARWSAIESSELERQEAEAIRLERDDERAAADADREARMQAMEDAIAAYLRVADEYVDQTEANRDLAKYYAQLAAAPSETILRVILASMDIPDKAYIKEQDELYDLTAIDGNKRLIQIKRGGQMGYVINDFIRKEGSTLEVEVYDNALFHAALLDIIETNFENMSSSLIVPRYEYLVYDYSGSKWQIKFLKGPDFIDFDLGDPVEAGLRITGSPSPTASDEELWYIDNAETFRIIPADSNTGSAEITISDSEKFNTHYQNLYTEPPLAEYGIYKTSEGWSLDKCLYNATGSDHYDRTYENVESLQAALGLSITGTPDTGDKWRISRVDYTRYDLTYGELGLFDGKMYVGTGAGSEEIGGGSKPFVARATAPSDTSILWIDTSNNSTLKYYDGANWVPCNTAVFG